MDRYEEALERAKKELQACGSTDCDAYKQIIRLFPELAESDGERIRIELIEFVKSCGGFKQEYIAWLEKQKSIEPIDLKTWKYVVDAVLTEREGIGQYIDNPWTKEIAEKLQKRFGDIEHKPTEWSEEDEHRVKDTIYFLETAKKHYASTVELDACIDWLKSLKQRHTWKPSETEIKVLEGVIKGIYNPSDYQLTLNSVLFGLKRLKGE